MSYCRKGIDSDVYMIMTGEGYLTCCACELNNKEPYFIGRKEALQHLKEHIDYGHKVPTRALDRLRREIAEEKGKVKKIQNWYLRRRDKHV